MPDLNPRGISRPAGSAFFMFWRGDNAHALKRSLQHNLNPTSKRVHIFAALVEGTLRVTPAMAAGISDRLWGLEDMVGLM